MPRLCQHTHNLRSQQSRLRPPRPFSSTQAISKASDHRGGCSVHPDSLSVTTGRPARIPLKQQPFILRAGRPAASSSDILRKLAIHKRRHSLYPSVTVIGDPANWEQVAFVLGFGSDASGSSRSSSLVLTDRESSSWMPRRIGIVLRKQRPPARSVFFAGHSTASFRIRSPGSSGPETRSNSRIAVAVPGLRQRNPPFAGPSPHKAPPASNDATGTTGSGGSRTCGQPTRCSSPVAPPPGPSPPSRRQASGAFAGPTSSPLPDSSLSSSALVAVLALQLLLQLIPRVKSVRSNRGLLQLHVITFSRRCFPFQH